MSKERFSVPSKYSDLVAVKYAQKVARGEIIAGKYVILACVGFLNDLNRIEDEDFEWDFDTDIYELIVGFASLFRFADGISAGKKMALAEFQEWIITNLFCWVHKEHGYVRYSRAYIQVSRKQGKSFLLGLIMLIKSLLEEYGQFTTVATKKDQARIVIKEIKKLLDCSVEEVKERFTIYGKADVSKIVCELTQSEIIPLSADANTLDGQGVDLCVVDEFGAHKDYSLYEVMRSSQTYKLNSQIVIITTAYPNVSTSPAYTERCILIDQYEGKKPKDERYFSAIFELDEEDDYNDRSTWGKSNPLFVQFPEIMKKLESDYINALNDTEKLQLFLTKNLNIWLSADALISYLDYDSWKEKSVEEIDFTGREVVIGVDMSKSVDLTGVSIVAVDEKKNILIKSKAFLPEAVVNQKEISDKMPYTSYSLKEDKDWLTITSGKYVRQTEVEEYIRSIEDRYNCRIKAIAFDSWGALHLMSSLSQDYEVIDVKMSYKLFSPVIKKFREMVYDNRVIHEYNPILNFCVANAIVKSDLQENILLDKKKSQNRIDLLVSTIIAYSEIFNSEIEEEAGYFIV